MPFKNLNLKHSYNSERDDVLLDFYIPVLKEAISYKRITGYFSSSSFALAAEGLAEFVKHGGFMQFIINVKLSPEDYNEIEKGLKRPEEILENIFIEDLEELEDEFIKNHARILGWLIANKFLELKVGYVKNPRIGPEILHQKVGILKDVSGNIISFSGSNNESALGWRFNSEKFKVFFSWDGGDAYVQQDLTDFEELWMDKSNKTAVISFPEAVKKKLMVIAPKSEVELEELFNELREIRGKVRKDQISLYDYQQKAIGNWFANNGRGIFEMATGTGKTYTAAGVVKELLSREGKLIVVISCPFLHLIPQWERSLSDMGIEMPKILASSIDPKWPEKISEKLLDFRLGRLNKFLILTTHDTVSSNKFIELIGNVNAPLFMISDEVHGMGSINRIEGLLPAYQYRLGLTATPYRYFDEVGTQELFNFFGKTVYEFGLERAINEINPATGKTFLTPYEYHPLFVDLTIEELDRYVQLSIQIGKLYAMGLKTKKDQEIYDKKLRDRQDIIKNAFNKYKSFSELLHELKENNQLKRTLVYCSPQQKEHVQGIIRNEGKIIQHQFTSDEDAIKKDQKLGGLTEREYILKSFDDGLYDILVAIKCLDEGVDVPSTKTAILLSNTGNPKEWIQRRGRVLRRFPGKDKAIIYDFIVIPNIVGGEVTEYERKIVESQFNRIDEFAKIALNYSELSRGIFKVKLKYRALEGSKEHD